MLHSKFEIQRPILFVLVASTLAIVWGVIGYYVVLYTYFITSFLFYPGIFLLGMRFRVHNSLFISFTYLLAYGSDLASRIIIETPSLQQPLFIFLILYHIELVILSIMKVKLDAKDLEWDAVEKWLNIGIALLLPSIALVVYYIILRQVFVFE